MKTHSIKFNFIMNALLTISQVIFPMITFPYYSRVLGAEGTGSISFALAVVSYFTMIASLGIPTYGIRACAKVRAKYSVRTHAVCVSETRRPVAVKYSV